MFAIKSERGWYTLVDLPVHVGSVNCWQEQEKALTFETETEAQSRAKELVSLYAKLQMPIADTIGVVEHLIRPSTRRSAMARYTVHDVESNVRDDALRNVRREIQKMAKEERRLKDTVCTILIVLVGALFLLALVTIILEKTPR